VYFIVVCAICHRAAGEEGGAGVRGIAVASHVSVGDVGNGNDVVIVQKELVNSSRCFPGGECEAIVARRLPFIGGSGRDGAVAGKRRLYGSLRSSREESIDSLWRVRTIQELANNCNMESGGFAEIACRLNRSMQHYLVVYLLAFESPRSLSVVD
jgi:hypothetical protein